MAGAPQRARQQPEASPLELREDEKVSYWIRKGSTAVLGVTFTLFLTMFGWVVKTVNEIQQQTAIVAPQTAETRKDILALKDVVYGLAAKSENWVTKDQMLDSRDVIMQQITALKDRLNALEVRVQYLDPDTGGGK